MQMKAKNNQNKLNKKIKNNYKMKRNIIYKNHR